MSETMKARCWIGKQFADRVIEISDSFVFDDGCRPRIVKIGFAKIGGKRVRVSAEGIGTVFGPCTESIVEYYKRNAVKS